MAVLKIVWPRKFCKSCSTLSNKHLDECSEPFPDVVLVKRRFLQEEVNIISTERENHVKYKHCKRQNRHHKLHDFHLCHYLLKPGLLSQILHQTPTSQFLVNLMYQPLSLNFESSDHLKKTALPSPSASSSAS